MPSIISPELEDLRRQSKEKEIAKELFEERERERDDNKIVNGKYLNRNSFESNPVTRTFGSSGWDLPAAERGIYDNEVFQTDKTLQSERSVMVS